MKKISLLMAHILITSPHFAQYVSIGLKGGTNICNINAATTYKMRYRIDFYGGLFVRVNFKSSTALQLEGVNSSQGAKHTTRDGNEHTLSLNYINIPLQLQYMFNNGFRIQTGPQVGFLAQVKDKVRETETGFFTSQDFKTVDFSWTAGLGYLSYSGLGIDARYNFGISDINNADNNVLKNNVFQLGVFYMLKNNHKAVSR